MKKTTFFRFSTAFLVAVFFIFTACQDKDYYVPVDPDSESSDAPSLLTYSTSQNVLLNVDYEAPEGLVSVFEVYTQNPLVLNADGHYELKSDLAPIAGGICVDGKIQINKAVPASTKELYVYSPDLFVPTLMSAKIEAGTANFEVVDLTISFTEANSRTIAANTIDGYLNGYSGTTGVGIRGNIDTSNYRPRYIFDTKNVPAKYLNRINNTFPDKKPVTNKDYFHDAILYLYKEAEVKLSMIAGDAEYNNSLSYFFYDGTPAEIETVDKNKVKEIVALPCAKLLPREGGMKAGDLVQLMYYNETTKAYQKEFPKGVTIGFVLRSNAYREGWLGAYVDENTNKFYSCAAWNKTLDPVFPQHTIYFNAATEEEDESFICFGFEDTKGGGDKDCNDVMIHVDINPGNAIEEPPHVPEVGEIKYVESRKGTLAFEDNWPWKGDYDLNDLVVTYDSKTTYVQRTEDGKPVSGVMLRSVEDLITLVHAGADFTNAFAYKMDISPSLVKSATLAGAAYTPVADGNGFIVKIADDVATEVQSENPSKDVYISTPKEFKVKLTFNEENGITQSDFNTKKLGAPYNPFISPRAGVEVHLPFYPPTTNVNMELFGKTDDRSDPDSGRWYVGAVNNPYPFAIHLFNVSGFKKLPVENQKISYTYPKFETWVKSGFTESLDWYEYPADVN